MCARSYVELYGSTSDGAAPGFRFGDVVESASVLRRYNVVAGKEGPSPLRVVSAGVLTQERLDRERTGLCVRVVQNRS